MKWCDFTDFLKPQRSPPTFVTSTESVRPEALVQKRMTASARRVLIVRLTARRRPLGRVSRLRPALAFQQGADRFRECI